MIYKAIRDLLFAKIINAWAKHDYKALLRQTIPENVIQLSNIPYITDGHRGHQLDVYYPAGTKGPFPVIINIHGGGFIYGDKRLNRVFCFHLAKKGFLIFDLNHRLANDDVKVPDQIRDIVCAMDWIGNNVDSYSELFLIDKNKIYLAGESSGAYLAVMAVLVSKSQRLQELFGINKPNIRINALAIICGFFEWAHRGIYFGLRSLVLDKGYKKQQYYRDLILKNIPEIVDLPPVFLISSGDDMLKDMTFNFVKLLKENNLEHRLVYVEKNRHRKYGHIFNVFYPDWEESKRVNDEMLEFLLRY